MNPLVAPETRKFRAKIDSLQNSLLAMPQADTQLEHFYAHGLYGRKLFIPKGTAYVGKIHRFSHVRLVLEGHLIIATETGRFEYKAPHVMVTLEGTRRVGYAVEDTLVMTVHATQHTELDEIEREIIFPREEQLAEEERLLLEEFK